MGRFEDDLASFKEAQLEELSAEDEAEIRSLIRLDLSANVEEFYNTCHEPDTGIFCEGADGPGRVKDNLKKAEAVLGKKAPRALKNLLTRRLGRANKKAQATLPKNSPAYQRALAKRVAEKRTIRGEE